MQVIQNSALIYSEGKFILINSKNEKYYISSQDKMSPIGSGVFGTIYKCTNQSGEVYAVKEILKNHSSTDERHYKNEKQIMEQIANLPKKQNLLYSIDIIEDSQKLYIIMPYYNLNNLSVLIEKKEIKTEMQALEYFRQICYGVYLLHGNTIIHRDLKTDNILIKSNCLTQYKYPHYLAICDFGISKIFSNPNENTANVGSFYTQAPEVEESLYDTRADIYSLGCILFKMITGSYPESKTTLTVSSYFTHDKLSIFTMSLLERCLQINPKYRLGEDQLFKMMDIEHLWNNYKPLDANLQWKSVISTINMNKYMRPITKNKQISISSKSYKICSGKSISVSGSNECTILPINFNYFEDYTIPVLISKDESDILSYIANIAAEIKKDKYDIQAITNDLRNNDYYKNLRKDIIVTEKIILTPVDEKSCLRSIGKMIYYMLFHEEYPKDKKSNYIPIDYIPHNFVCFGLLMSIIQNALNTNSLMSVTQLTTLLNMKWHSQFIKTICYDTNDNRVKATTNLNHKFSIPIIWKIQLSGSQPVNILELEK